MFHSEDGLGAVGGAVDLIDVVGATGATGSDVCERLVTLLAATDSRLTSADGGGCDVTLAASGLELDPYDDVLSATEPLGVAGC